MADPLSITTGVLSLVGVVLKVSVTAIGMVDKTTGAHEAARDALRNLRRALQNLNKGTSNIQTLLRILISDPKDKAVKKLLALPEGEGAVKELCESLEATRALLAERAGQAQLETTGLEPLPQDRRSLAFVQAVFKHNFSPSNIEDAITALKDFQFEVKSCQQTTELAFRQVWSVYDIMRSRNPQRQSSVSTISSISTEVAGSSTGSQATTSFRSELTNRLERMDNTSKSNSETPDFEIPNSATHTGRRAGIGAEENTSAQERQPNPISHDQGLTRNRILNLFGLSRGRREYKNKMIDPIPWTPPQQLSTEQPIYSDRGVVSQQQPLISATIYGHQFQSTTAQPGESTPQHSQTVYPRTFVGDDWEDFSVPPPAPEPPLRIPSPTSPPPPTPPPDPYEPQGNNEIDLPEGAIHFANHRQQHQIHPQQRQRQQRQKRQQRQRRQQRQKSQQEKDRISVMAIPSMEIVGNQVVLGNAQSMSERSYTFVEAVADGPPAQVWLCDWHSPLPPHVTLPRMQQGPGMRAEWQGKRLVAIKRMKKLWEGGWDECKKHPEVESLRSIPPHENVISLYDCFILPSTKELYFVFECMEGNLYQLIKSRKGRPLAGGLVSSIFRQVTAGLAHIHNSGYFHRDIKPANLLFTTTGITHYATVSPIAPPGAPPEKDLMVVVKLADFRLASEIQSTPPSYTEYVSTKYRAPEVLLRSTYYSSPVDLWALGTIIAELVNLKPLFPGINEYDQVEKIFEVLGDPSDYGFDSQGRPRGGGKWPRGLKIAIQSGLVYEKIQPLDFYSLFDVSIPRSLIDCIAALLRYEPEARLTARECLEHQYFIEMTPPFSYPTSLQTPSDFSGSSSSSKDSKPGN